MASHSVGETLPPRSGLNIERQTERPCAPVGMVVRLTQSMITTQRGYILVGAVLCTHGEGELRYSAPTGWVVRVVLCAHREGGST